MRVRLTVSYDGTNYCGWQVQPNGITIEEELNRAISELFQRDIRVIGASRTDAGVHSLGNIAIFDVDTRMDVSKIAYALNTRLPSDIAVLKSEQVADDWHPHLVDSVKTYEYRILNRSMPDPIRRLNTLHYHHNLDVEAMSSGATYLIGHHDFTSFASVKSQVKTFDRTLYDVSVIRDGDLIIIRCQGDGFLYNMVRIIAGTLIQVGAGQIEPVEVKRILESRDREMAGPTAPAVGLTMMGIEYI